jgi:hypothetical protein
MVSVWRADTKDTLPADTTNVFCSSVLGLAFHRSTSLNLDLFHTQNFERQELGTPILETEIWQLSNFELVADFIRHVGPLSRLILWQPSSPCAREMPENYGC